MARSSGSSKSFPLVQVITLVTGVVACCAAVVVIPEVRRTLGLDPPAPGAGIPPPTLATGFQVTTAPDVQGSTLRRQTQPPVSVPEFSPTSIPIPSGPVDLNGVWVGTLTYVLGENIENFKYRINVTQEGDAIYGISRIEHLNSPDAFVEYSFGAQLVDDGGQLIVQLSENELGHYNQDFYMGVVPNDPITYKRMILAYRLSQEKEILEGEWRDYANTRSDGKVRLARSP